MDSALLAMLQVNIALGILYVALKESRYRDKLFGEIVDAFLAKELDEEDEEDEEGQEEAVEDEWNCAEDDGDRQSNDELLDIIRDRIADDNKFADDFHRLAMWRGELPVGELERSRGTLADLMSVTIPKRAPWDYRWFRCNGDKFVCFFSAVILPIPLLWALVLPYPPVSENRVLYDAAVAFGQVCIAGHVALGRCMVWRHVRKFRRTLDALVLTGEGVRARRLP